MDISSRPTYVEASAEESLGAAQDFCDRCTNMIRSMPEHMQLAEPVLTPRFVPTCSPALLSGLGGISEQKHVRVQSHMAEAHDQVQYVREERGEEDMDVFLHVGPDLMQLVAYQSLTMRTMFTEQSAHLSHGTSALHLPLPRGPSKASCNRGGSRPLPSVECILLRRAVPSTRGARRGGSCGAWDGYRRWIQHRHYGRYAPCCHRLPYARGGTYPHIRQQGEESNGGRLREAIVHRLEGGSVPRHAWGSPCLGLARGLRDLCSRGTARCSME